MLDIERLVDESYAIAKVQVAGNLDRVLREGNIPEISDEQYKAWTVGQAMNMAIDVSQECIKDIAKAIYSDLLEKIRSLE